MLEALVITLREGIEIALALGIVITYLRKTGRQDILPWVWTGLGLAVLASMAAAWALPLLPISGELFEGIVMWTAAALVTTMIVWMHFTAKNLKREIEERLDSITHQPTSTGAALAAAAFTFLMVFREGAEMVLFLSAINLSTESLMGTFGGLLGLALAAVFGVAFVRGTLKVDLGKFFQVTEIVLMLFVAQLLIGGYHEMSEAGVVPTSPTVMGLIGPLVTHNVLFLIALLALPLLVWMLPGTRERRLASEAQALEGAERRSRLAEIHRDRRWRLSAGTLAALTMALLTVGHVYASKNRALSPATPVTAVDGLVSVSLESLREGQLQRMTLDVDGVPVRFIALKTGEDTYAAGLDACDLCGTFGYVQEGSQLICMNCSAEINPVTVGEAGGCNPVPLPSVTEAGALKIQARDIAAGRARFAGGVASGPSIECPVCGMALKASEAVAVEHDGRSGHICTMSACRERFDAEPARYLP